MADDNAQYDSYEGGTENLGAVIIYPIIASVFSAFCILSIAAFLLSSRKCCKQRKNDDPESALLKERLLKDQKRMSTYKFRFLFGERPLFSSIMQQNENDIAQEVKESYKSISTDINKPIICCPNNKISYIYNPKELGSLSKRSQISKEDDEQHKIVKINNLYIEDKNLDKDSLNGKSLDSIKKSSKRLTGDFQMDSLEKKPLQRNNININSSERKIANKFFTESEIENAEDLKSLFFKKWIKHTNSEKPPDGNSELHTHQMKLDTSYDDVESVLTSISRMDSCKMQKLRDSKFYQKLISQMETIGSENSSIGEDHLEPEDLNEIILSKTGKLNINQNLSHEEIMQVAIGTGKYENNDENIVNNSIGTDNFSVNKNNTAITDDGYSKTEIITQKNIPGNSLPKKENRKVPTAKELADRKIIQHIINSKQNTKPTKYAKLTTIPTDKKSECLFKAVRPGIVGEPLSESRQTPSELFKSTRDDNNLEESDITNSEVIQKIRQHRRRNRSYLEETHSDSEIDSVTKSSLVGHSTMSRPKSLDLKRKNTDLKIDVSFIEDEISDKINISKKRSNVAIDENSYSSSCSSKSSTITTWQEIDENVKHERDKTYEKKLSHDNRKISTKSLEKRFQYRSDMSPSLYSTIYSSSEYSKISKSNTHTSRRSVHTDTSKTSATEDISRTRTPRRRSSTYDSTSGSYLNTSSMMSQLTNESSSSVKHRGLKRMPSITPKRRRKEGYKRSHKQTGIILEPRYTSSNYS